MGTPHPGAFGELLKRRRQLAELTQEALAARAGLSVRGISDLERGARLAPRVETIHLLCDALRLTPDDRAALVAAAHGLSSPPLLKEDARVTTPDKGAPAASTRHREELGPDTRPVTKYAKSGDIHIAYQVVGDGPIDLLNVQGWVTNVEYAWEDPNLARFFRRLASFSRLITFDKRGTGMSDRVTEMPALEERMDDVRAVLDAAGSRRAALWGTSEGAPMCALFAATYPERTAALIMYGGYPRVLTTDDYPFGRSAADHQRMLDEVERDWGGPVGSAIRAPSMVGDRRYMEWWATYLRMSSSPGATLTLMRMNAQIDIRDVLPAIRVPTLIMHRTGDRALRVEGSRYMAARIPGAKYVELSGEDHMWWVGDTEAILEEIELFLQGVRPGGRPDRILATVLQATVLSSPAMRPGDDRGRLDGHPDLAARVREELARFRGREVGAAGDTFKATFDGPGRAIRCACAIRDAVRAMGLEATAGLHTGECEVLAGGLAGLAFRMAAQVGAQAAPGEVLVSGTVRDLVAGSGIELADRGVRVFEDVPGEWRLLAVV